MITINATEYDNLIEKKPNLFSYLEVTDDVPNKNCKLNPETYLLTKFSAIDFSEDFPDLNLTFQVLGGGGGKRRTRRRIPPGLISSKKRRGRSRKLKNAKSNLNFSTKKK